MAARKSLQELALTNNKYSYRNSPDYSNTDISTSITEWRRNPAWLPMPGFNYVSDNSFSPPAMSGVGSVKIQSDGKIVLLSGYGSTCRRLNANGTSDSSFTTGSLNFQAWDVEIQSDGKILVAGNFTSYNGTTVNRIVRLNSDGSIDTSFNIGTGFDDIVYGIKVQNDGKILCVGQFASYQGTTYNKIIRLNSDGSIDTSFNIGTGFDSNYAKKIYIQSDGKILIGGSFLTYQNVSSAGLVRINSNGSIDTTFPNFSTNVQVYDIGVQSSGKIVVGGIFSTYNNLSYNAIVRFNRDGSLDQSLRIGTGFNLYVTSLSILSDDYILTGGAFTSFNGTGRQYFARLNPDGSLDTTLNIGTVFNDTVGSTNSIAIQSDAKIVVGYGNGLIRLNVTEEKIAILKAVYANSDFTTLRFEGNYTINWGDGNTENLAANTLAFHQYDYANTNLANTNGPVTFTDAGDLVTRTAHGYANTDIITFSTIANTTGITVDTPYYVANSTANTFQLSNTSGGSIVPLTTDGTGTLLPYKQVLITITPQAGANLTNVILNLANTTQLTTNFGSNFLDISASVPRVTDRIGIGSIRVGSFTNYVSMGGLERVSFHNTSNVTSMSYMFYICPSLQSVPLFNTSNVTNMQGMFYACPSLQSVPLFNTANVTSMSNMFYQCSSLRSVPLFNTAKVTDMSTMFYSCPSLQSVPLFNTANVTSMGDMFNGCRSLQSVPLFNTDKVIDMGGMFNGCHSLQSVPQFNTANVTSMISMFNGCYSLQSVPPFDTANVVTMSNMFYICPSLKIVPLFNTAKVTGMSNMFNSCSSLKTVPLFNTTNVTDMSSMFIGCNSLQSVPQFNTAKVTNMSFMFQSCYSLRSVPLFNTANVTTMNYMFYFCSLLKTVPLFNTNKVTNMSQMFRDCSSLQSVPLFNTANVTDMSYMFNSCYSLQSVPQFNTANVVFMSNMFYDCRSLQSVPLFNTANVTTMGGMFVNCNSLKTVPLFNTAKVTDMSTMFYICSSLQSVPLFNTVNVTNMGGMVNFCISLQSVPQFNTANVTTMQSMFSSCYNLQSVPLFNTDKVTNMGTMFGFCRTLKEIPSLNCASVSSSSGFSSIFIDTRITRSQLANTKFSIDYSNQNLSNISLNEIYTNLPTVVGQTITVTGNWGTATDDPTIATAKGWTVTG